MMKPEVQHHLSDEPLADDSTQSQQPDQTPPENKVWCVHLHPSDRVGLGDILPSAHAYSFSLQPAFPSLLPRHGSRQSSAIVKSLKPHNSSGTGSPLSTQLKTPSDFYPLCCNCAKVAPVTPGDCKRFDALQTLNQYNISMTQLKLTHATHTVAGGTGHAQRLQTI